MNQILQELITQATHNVLGVQQLDSIQLAELIVLECVETLGSFEKTETHEQQMELLKKHFGVE